MNLRPAPAATRHGAPRTGRTVTVLAGLTGFLTAAIGFAPAASATLAPPEPSAAPVTPPSPTVTARFPLWVIITIVAATIVLSVATTLVTLSLERMRQARHAPMSASEPQAAEQPPPTVAEPVGEQGEILASHHYAAEYDMYRPGRR